MITLEDLKSAYTISDAYHVERALEKCFSATKRGATEVWYHFPDDTTKEIIYKAIALLRNKNLRVQEPTSRTIKISGW